MTLTPGMVLSRSPFLGEHTAEVLRSTGMDEQEIRSVLDRNVAYMENEISSEPNPADLEA
jgi:crotonobetainyl-CoA:carnitine CoA-transferase CaiB-like acyl-CoA transferase